MCVCVCVCEWSGGRREVAHLKYGGCIGWFMLVRCHWVCDNGGFSYCYWGYPSQDGLDSLPI